MGVAKVILNGVTQMDVTQDTVLSTNLLTGYTAHAANGEVVTGAYEGGKDELALLLSGKLSSYSNSSLSTLVSYAFAYASSLSFVSIPNISTIPTGCFAGCLMLSSIVISSGASITIWPNAFSGCKRFSGDYSFFQKIKEVGSYAFSNCSAITSAPFGSFLTHLGSCAFYNCTSLTDVDLTALSIFNGQTTGASVFTGCQRLSLGTVLLSNNISLGEATSVFINCGIASVDTYMGVSLSTLAAVGRNLFWSCGYLSKLHVDGMRYIPAGFAAYCSRLNDIYFPSAEACIAGSMCFAYCSSLTKVTNDEFPLLVGLCSSMFASCTNLSIFSLSTLGSNALTYGTYDHPLRYCSNLKRISAPTVEYPGSLPNIGLTALEHLTIGGYAAYSYHYSSHRVLSTIVFRNRLTTINSSAFYGDYMLTSLYLICSSVSTIPTLGNANAFTSTPISNYTTSTSGVYGSIFVPASLYDAYVSATNWTTYSARIASLTDQEISYVLQYGTHDPVGEGLL